MRTSTLALACGLLAMIMVSDALTPALARKSPSVSQYQQKALTAMKNFHLSGNFESLKRKAADPCQQYAEAIASDATCMAFLTSFAGGDGDGGDEEMDFPPYDAAIFDKLCVTGDCFNKVYRLLQCSMPEDFPEAMAQYFTELFCLEDDQGNSCYEFASELEVLMYNYEMADGSVAKTAALDEVCVPCYYNIINLFTKYHQVDTADLVPATDGMALICQKEGDKYCPVALEEIDNLCSDEEGFECTLKKTDAQCASTCWTKLLSTMMLDMDETSEEYKEILFYLENGCLKNNNGEYCFFLTFEYPDYLVANCSADFTAGCGNPACSYSLHAYVDRLGCCADVTMTVLDDGTDGDIPSIIENTCPDIEFPETCPRIAPGTQAAIKTVKTSFDYSWVTKNRASFDSAFCSDIARHAGILAEDCKVLSVKKSSSRAAATSVQFSIIGTSQDATNKISADMDRIIEKNQIIYTKTLATAPSVDGSNGALASALHNAVLALALVAAVFMMA